MKFIFSLLLSILYTGLIFSQQSNTKNKHPIKYTNTINLDFFMNKDNSSTGEFVNQGPFQGTYHGTFQGQGMGIELNSFYGIVFLKKLSLSAGLGVVFNFQENLNALPVVAQVKWYYNDYNKNGLFLLLNTGTNIAVGNFKKGQTGKLGVGYAFNINASHFNYEISAIFKFKNFILDNNTSILRESVGISLGIQFN